MNERLVKNTHLMISGARENNLKNLSLELPHDQLIGVLGVSGSGKSSLVHDLIAQEAHRAFLEFIPNEQKRFVSSIAPADLDHVSGLRPCVSLKQAAKRSQQSHAELGLSSGLYDYLRLLFARFAVSEEHQFAKRSTFSFKHTEGACEHCHGLGLIEIIDKKKLIADESLSLRQGCLSPTLPNGYIMYSQVTIDSLNMVCEAHGFDVDIPWNQLSEAQQNVVFHGSDRLKVPLGKHSEESRLKWTGLKAKARESDFYKGLLNSMENILLRDRNPNILKYTSSLTCPHCRGSRLNEKARSFYLLNKTITELSEMTFVRLVAYLKKVRIEVPKATELLDKMLEQLADFILFGLDDFSLSSKIAELSSGQQQILRILNQLAADLSGMIYIFDEPSAGLHPKHRDALLNLFRSLVQRGNTVFIVEHDLQMIAQCDHIVELGPQAGINGGELLFNGSLNDFLTSQNSRSAELVKSKITSKASPTKLPPFIELEPDLETLPKGQFLVLPASEKRASQLAFSRYLTQFKNAKFISQQAIGKTPRSNPATYIGLAELIRDRFAKEAKREGLNLNKSSFSFNTKGGRCETCLGAGKLEVGMHYLGKVELLCDECAGERFKPEVLAAKLHGANIAEVYKMSVREALEHFTSDEIISQYLLLLHELGLSYLSLGQSSNTLSGGEAQRIKLAKALLSSNKTPQEFLINEPGAGLHELDLEKLMKVFKKLSAEGHSFLVHAFRATILEGADALLGESHLDSFFQAIDQSKQQNPASNTAQDAIVLKGVRTHNLKGFDLHLPKNSLNIIVGPSGSGKTSLAFHTLAAESKARYMENWNPHFKTQLRTNNSADFESASGITPCVSLRAQAFTESSRSTLGSTSGISFQLRLLFSRLYNLEHPEAAISAGDLSFHKEAAACPTCAGKGSIKLAQKELLVADWTKMLDHAFVLNSALNYYSDVHSQYMAIWREVAKVNKIPDLPLNSWKEEDLHLLFYGSGERIWETTWFFKNKTRSGEQSLSAPWKGLLNYLNEEYSLKKNNKNSASLKLLFEAENCSACEGKRLNEQTLSYHYKSESYHDWCEKSIVDLLQFLEEGSSNELENKLFIRSKTMLKAHLEALIALNLGELNTALSMNEIGPSEKQGIKLAAASHSALGSMTFILDEPSLGLNQDQIKTMLQLIQQLKNKGNTIVLVEHNTEVIKHADHIIELGPEAGEKGGQLLFSGSFSNYQKQKKSSLKNGDAIAAKGLISKRGKPLARLSQLQFHPQTPSELTFHQGELVLLKDAPTSIQSQFLERVVYKSFKHTSMHTAKLELFDFKADDVYLFHNRTKRPNTTLLSFLNLDPPLQNKFRKTARALEAGLKAKHFSLNSLEGRCPHCKGKGQEQIAMDFLDDLYTPCEWCAASGFNPEILEHRIAQKHIGEVLASSIADLSPKWELFFEFSKKDEHLSQALGLIMNLGLAHLNLGRKLSTLSSGEWQRTLLLCSLMTTEEHQKRGKIFLFDQIFSGLSEADVQRLLPLFQDLLDRQNCLVFANSSFNIA
ncbi:MAG: AAA family ATPase [Flavobacteriales bacterium]|nr:AAA family ATPase [Flavobacteriales bacterium]